MLSDCSNPTALLLVKAASQLTYIRQLTFTYLFQGLCFLVLFFFLHSVYTSTTQPKTLEKRYHGFLGRAVVEFMLMFLFLRRITFFSVFHFYPSITSQFATRILHHDLYTLC